VSSGAASAGRSPYARHGWPVRLVYVLVALCAYVLQRLGLVANAGGVILCYHAIRPSQRERFVRQMRHIAGRAVSLESWASASWGAGNRASGIGVTFDDAFACLLEQALPATRELGIPVTIFVPTANLGRRPVWFMPEGHPEARECVLTAADVQRVHQPGLVDFGSHTCTHSDLTRLSPAALAMELEQSRQDLEALLSAPVRDLALPHGAGNEQVLAAARAAGYVRIYTVEARLVAPGSSGPCGRFSMSPEAWSVEFWLTCAGAYAWLQPWRHWVRQVRECRWSGLRRAVHVA